MKDAGESWLDEVRWGADGLVPAIAQDSATGDVLTLAWVNREALRRTLAEGYACYWSRSRQRLWRKGEVSGHVQKVQAIFLDCDADTLVLRVEQRGGIACHTGHRSCFFRRLENGAWRELEPALKSPREIYREDRND